jgi:hypothetical protein
MLRASAGDRVGLLRELIRGRAVMGDSTPIDGCSVDRFLDDLRTWRDSLLPAELARVSRDGTCDEAPRPRPGRFVITRWYQNPAGDYVIRGNAYPWDEVYRFSDGVFSRKERTEESEFSAGIASPARVDSSPDSSGMARPPAPGDTASDSARAGPRADSGSARSRADSAGPLRRSTNTPRTTDSTTRTTRPRPRR